LLFFFNSFAAAQTWIELSPVGGPSGPILLRQTDGKGYDAANNRLIVYFQSNPSVSSNPFPEVWVLTNANGLGGTPTWTQLNPGGSAPTNNNGNASAVYDATTNRLIVHGGCYANCSPAQSSVHVLTNANGLGGLPEWIPLPAAPIGRANHTATYDPGSNRMTIFGGNLAFFGTNRNDVWLLSDANGIGGPGWAQLFPGGTLPPAREATQSVYDPATNRLILFGGAAYPNSFTAINYNDVWVLTDANGLGSPGWIQLAPAGTPPPARVYFSMVYDPAENQAIIFGGFFDDRAEFLKLDDVWVLTHANGLGGAPTWMQLTPSGTPPGPNYSHAAAFDSVHRRMIVFGGADGSGVVHKRVWVLVFNRPPVANAGPDQTVECASPGATQVTLDGSGSSDPDAGQTLSYTWTGPFPEGGGTVTGVNPTVTLALGTHTITLNVDDGNGGTASDTVQVSVQVRVEGLLSPLAALVPEGGPPLLPDKAFKQGRALPLKLQLFCSAAALTDFNVPAPRIVGLRRNGDTIDMATLDLDAGESNDSGTMFRYSAPNWVFNLNTKGLAAGTYIITIETPDGQRYSAAFVLR